MRDVLDFVPVAGLQADIHHVGAIADLPTGDLASLFPFFFGDHVLEKPRPDDIGALADDQWAIAFLGFDQFFI